MCHLFIYPNSSQNVTESTYIGERPTDEESSFPVEPGEAPLKGLKKPGLRLITD